MKTWKLSLNSPAKSRRLGWRALVAMVALSAVLSVALLYARSQRPAEPYLLASSSEVYSAVSSGGAVAIMFSSPTCPVCEKMEPYWAALASRGGVLAVRFYVVRLGEGTAEAFYKYGVTSTPTYILFLDGRVAARYVGEFPGPNVTQSMLSWVLASLVQPLPQAGAPQGNSCEAGSCPVEPRSQGSGLPLVAAVVSFFAGVLAAFSPCTLPLLIAHAAASARVGARASRMAGGCFAASASSILALGLLFALLSKALSAAHAVLTPFTAILLLLLGASGVAGYRVDLPAVLPGGRLGVYGRCGLFGFLSVQCNLPLVLGPFLAVVGTSMEDFSEALYLALGYSLGTSSVLALALSGSGKVASLFERALYREDLVNRLSGLLLIAAGTLLLFQPYA